MPGLEQVELRTERLLLRAPTESDAEELFRIHASIEVMKYSNGLPWQSMDQALNLVRSAQSWARSGRHLCLCILEDSLGIPVGTTTLYDIDTESGRCEIGFLSAERVWRRGYMSEALTAIIDYAFCNLDLNRIEADTDPRNAGAVGLLESLGFVQEGLFRQRWIVAGRKTDSAMFGLLREEWDPGVHRRKRSVA